jgi:phosphate uptake regulator
MIRKLIKQGHNTLTVTLPSEWIKRFNLKAGSEINLIKRDGGLFLGTEKINEQSEIEIDIKELNIQLIWKHLISAYREGYDKMTVKFDPKTKYDSPFMYFAHHTIDNYYATQNKLSPREFISLATDRFVGIEVIDYGKDYIVLKEIGEATSKDFDASLRRIFLLLFQLCEDIKEALEKNKKEILEKMHTTDLQVDKFHDFCSRVLNKTGFIDPTESSLIFTLIYLLELLGDEFKHLAIQIRTKNEKDFNQKKIISSLDSIYNQMNIFYEIYYKYDRGKLIKLFEENSIFAKKHSLSTKKGYKEDLQVTLENINRYIDIMSEILVQKNFKRSLKY